MAWFYKIMMHRKKFRRKLTVFDVYVQIIQNKKLYDLKFINIVLFTLQKRLWKRKKKQQSLDLRKCSSLGDICTDYLTL